MVNFTPAQTFNYAKNEHINYEIHGNGPVHILFLHGFAASLNTWHDILPFFDKGKFTLYLIDLIGAGFSSKPLDSDYSIKGNAKVIQRFTKEKNIKNYFLVGHSFGSGVALITALDLLDSNDFKPRALVLIDAAVYKTELPFFVKYLRLPILNRLFLSLTSAEYKSKYTLKRLYYDQSKITNQIVDRYAFFMTQKDYDYALIETAHQIIPNEFSFYNNKYSSLHIPVLIIWGEQDSALPLSSGQRLHSELPNSRLEVISGCGHNPQEELPEKTFTLIMLFIRSNEGNKQ